MMLTGAAGTIPLIIGKRGAVSIRSLPPIVAYVLDS
jgi:hypothetical protein